MRVHPSVILLVAVLAVHGSYAFNIHSREKSDSVEEREILGRDTEPLDLDYVKGPISINPDDPGLGLSKVPETSSASHEEQFPVQSFNQHFGNIFGNGFLAAFPGLGFFDFPRYEPWWKGPNVCKTREEDIEAEDEKDGEAKETISDKEDSLIQAFHLNVETCAEKSNKYQCTKITNQAGKKRTYKITYKCCAGYARRRSAENPNGNCVKLDLAPIENTIEKLGGKEFMKSAKKGSVESEMDDMTVFAPVDESFTDFAEKMFENNLVVVPLNKRERRDTSSDENGVNTRDLVHAHMVKGIIDIEEIENEQVLVSEYNNSTIRLNIFPRPPGDREQEFPYQYTANCVPIVKPNQLASNGMVHMIKGVLMPPEKTVMDMLRERPDMAVFVTVLERTKLDEMLMDPSRHVTVFAPTDSAFEKLDPQLRKKLKEGRGCASNILKNHILDLTFCSSAVADDAKTSAYNLLSERIELEYTDEAPDTTENEIADMTNKRFIIINKKARMTETDLMATNGVIHIIDSMLPTESAQTISSVLENNNSTIMMKLLEQGNLRDYVDDSMNTTFFAPTDKAFEQSETGKYWLKKLEENPSELKNNLELKNFVDYHIMQPMVKTCDLVDGIAKTRSDREVRVNLYSTNFPFMNIMNRATVNCARLVHFDEDSCGSVVHQVDKVLEVPKNNLLQQLEATEKYSTFLRLVKEANLTSLLEDHTKSYTLLVPKDEHFKEVEEFLSEIESKEDQKEFLIKSHIIPEVMCCAGITQSQWPFVRSIPALSQAHLRLDRDRRPKIQNAGITKCDIIATNGIIHEINDLIAVQKQRPQQPQHDQNPFRHDFFF
ncbi:transforming growth factor-beta-induced protein ig-h3 isoform X2 [Culicoides brevitarsis]|uniref:transforming growth factor-beta-induced protein ig-h3 isoform X2 n=1 Tax=Culicoides brevitarsis TaxID=469753 RepID=UPI00307BC366